MLRIKQLVIIAGPSAIGKSTLLEEIREGDASHLSEQLNIDLSSSYLYLDAMMLSEVNMSSVDRLILHYDFIHQYRSEDGFAYLSDLVTKSHNIVTVTLYTSNTILHKRITSRLIKAFLSFLHRPSPSKIRTIFKLWKKKQLYKNTSKLLSHYNIWSEFMKECGVVHHLMLDNCNSRVTGARPYCQDTIKVLMEGKD